MIDYALQKSDFKKLTLIGHSQGTSATFYGMVRRPDFYKEKVNFFAALGPVTRITHLKGDVYQQLKNSTNLIAISLDLLGVRELFKPNWMADNGMRLFC